MGPICSAIALLLAGSPASYQDTVDVTTVLVDVAVHDDDGHFVEGLRPADFQLYVDGERVLVESAIPIRHVAPDTPVAEAPAPAHAPRARPSERRLPPRHFVFLFDLSSVTPENVFRFWRLGGSAADWAEANLQPDDRVSIAVFNQRLRFVADDQPWRPQLTRQLRGLSRHLPDSFFDPMVLADGFFERSDTGPSAGGQRAEGDMFDRDRLDQLEVVERRSNVERLFVSMEAVLTRLESKQGRKAIMLLSEGHSLDLMLGGAGSYASSHMLRHFHNHVAPRFQAADAAVYALHTGGLRPTGDMPWVRKTGFGTWQAFWDLRSHAVDDIWNSQDLLAFFATQTGGQVVKNVNNFEYGLELLGRELSSYYQLSFRAPAAEPGSFHEVEVELDRDGVELGHKRGYVTPRPWEQLSADERERKLLSALGGAEPSFELPAEARLLTLPQAEGYWLGLMLRLPAGALASADGKLRVIAEARDELGAPVARLDELLSLDSLGADGRARLADDGLSYLGQLELPALSGSLRVVLRDESNGQLALRELPLALGREPLAPILLADGSHQPAHAGGQPDPLCFAGHPLRPAEDQVVRGGENVQLLVPLPQAETRQLYFGLRDADGRLHPIRRPVVSVEERPAHRAMLARLPLPEVPVGACSLEVRARVAGEPFATSMPLHCE